MEKSHSIAVATGLVIGVAFLFQGCALMPKGSLSRTPGSLPTAAPAAVKATSPKLDSTAPKPTREPKMSEIGHASWYGPGFAGKTTASGEAFDQKEFIAAHRTLPFGSKVRVVNLDNDKSVVVEIKDRGPFVEGRIIDVSQAAANALGMVQAGLARVRIEVFSLP
jgi:rare lipoprotein A